MSCPYIPHLEPLESRDVPAVLHHPLRQAHAVRVRPMITHVGPLAGFGYSPADVRHAYGLDAQPYTGLGQTIVLVEGGASEPGSLQLSADLFDNRFGVQPLRPGQLSVVQPFGPPFRIDADLWGEEEALDVEWAHAMAPDANVVCVEAPDESLGAYLALDQYARRLGAVTSNSAGTCEDLVPKHHAVDFLLAPPADPNALIVSGGDDGGLCELPGDGRPFIDWPASYPGAYAVGGTHGLGAGQVAWKFSTGGHSRLYHGRTTPDGAWIADQLPYADVDAAVDDLPIIGLAGGTSFGAPGWAGLVADADQARADHGEAPLTTDQLHRLPKAVYQDVTRGHSLAWAARRGYDLATGHGVPRAQVLVQDALFV
jgi:hypothetical protein